MRITALQPGSVVFDVCWPRYAQAIPTSTLNAICAQTVGEEVHVGTVTRASHGNKHGVITVGSQAVSVPDVEVAAAGVCFGIAYF